jgi:antitoxin component of RelBE/YafQ-DinJ toxin-antitoxin module
MTKALLNLKIDLDVREEFKLAAALRGATMSSLFHQYAFQIIREEQERYPAAFAYLNAGGSIDNAVKVARQFGMRPISEEDRANIRKMAEADREETLRAVRPESRKDVNNLINELTGGDPLVNDVGVDRSSKPRRAKKMKRA